MILVLVGPTGVGKSDLALALARRIGCEIISCDALQVYRGFDIGTAKPSAAARADIPHHLIDIRDPWEAYSAFDFWRDVRAVLQDLQGRGKDAILVGGTGFYVNILRNGLPDAPAPVAEFRDRLEDTAAREGCNVLHEQLRAVDPPSAREIHPHNVKRVIRALEMFEFSGERREFWQTQARGLKALGFEVEVVGLQMERATLLARIQARVERMFEDGFVEEVRSLTRVPWSRTARVAIGYSEVRDFLEGNPARDDVRNRMVARTRALVKKQMTWFRAMPEIEWVDAELEPQVLVERFEARA